jgi:hypothetical protein
MRKALRKITDQVRLFALQVRHPTAVQTIRAVKREKLTYLSFHELLNLTDVAIEFKNRMCPARSLKLVARWVVGDCAGSVKTR